MEETGESQSLCTPDCQPDQAPNIGELSDGRSDRLSLEITIRQCLEESDDIVHLHAWEHT
jgi:hypothetical protein